MSKFLLYTIKKGMCHEMNIYLRVYKVKSVLSVYALRWFKNFVGVHVAAIITSQNFCYIFQNAYLLILKILSEPSFKEFAAAFRNPPVTVQL